MGKSARPPRPSQAEQSSLCARLPPPNLPSSNGPAHYSRELADIVCDRVAGGESLMQLVQHPGMPAKSTVMRWFNYDVDGFAARYSRAREGLVEHWAEEVISIADDKSLEPNERRIMIEARLRLAAKLAPKRWSEKLQISGDPENPLMMLHQAVPIDRLSPIEMDLVEQLARARIAAQDAGIVDISKTYDETTG